MVGHKLGEFAPTRNFKGHSGSRNKLIFDFAIADFLILKSAESINHKSEITKNGSSSET
jgi:hypothetical protein